MIYAVFTFGIRYHGISTYTTLHSMCAEIYFIFCIIRGVWFEVPPIRESITNREFRDAPCTLTTLMSFWSAHGRLKQEPSFTVPECLAVHIVKQQDQVLGSLSTRTEEISGSRDILTNVQASRSPY